jgi:repressor LexA
MPHTLTDLERRILDFLVEYLRRHTYQPSVREIGVRFHIRSTKTVSELLQSLAVKGWIERDPSRSRGVRLLGLDMRPDAVSVPCLGPEGTPVERFEIDRKLAGGSGAFLITAGERCGVDGVQAGDLLLAEPTTEAAIEPDDVVVLRTPGDWAFGRSRDGGIEVLTAVGTAQLAAIGEVQLAGRVLCVVRRVGRGGARRPDGATVTPTPAS